LHQVISCASIVGEVVEHRVGVYLRETAPVLEHYGVRGLVYRVDGCRSVAEIQADLLAFPRSQPPRYAAS
jgi:adenylate kinase